MIHNKRAMSHSLILGMIMAGLIIIFLLVFIPSKGQQAGNNAEETIMGKVKAAFSSSKFKFTPEGTMQEDDVPEELWAYLDYLTKELFNHNPQQEFILYTVKMPDFTMKYDDFQLKFIKEGDIIYPAIYYEPTLKTLYLKNRDPSKNYDFLKNKELCVMPLSNKGYGAVAFFQKGFIGVNTRHKSKFDVELGDISQYGVQEISINLDKTSPQLYFAGEKQTIAYSDVHDRILLGITTNGYSCFFPQRGTGGIRTVPYKDTGELDFVGKGYVNDKLVTDLLETSGYLS